MVVFRYDGRLLYYLYYDDCVYFIVVVFIIFGDIFYNFFFEFQSGYSFLQLLFFRCFIKGDNVWVFFGIRE